MNKGDYLAVNQAAWDARTNTHLASDFYDVSGFLAGKSSLNPVELAQLGDVTGKRLLHLQCHFGQDTLSWARLGAKVTGVDLSGQAITAARRLASELSIDAQFINSDVESFGSSNHARFDIVFTSYGAICWLPDLSLWANTIAQALATGGEFHMVEFHPVMDLMLGYPYFDGGKAFDEEHGTYTENCDGSKHRMISFSHSLADVLSALINAGLVIEQFTEHAASPYPCFDGLTFVEGEGYYKYVNEQAVPMLFAIKARKP